MADETKRTGGEAVFDTDRAWERFEKAVAREPVPAIWTATNERPRSDNGTIEAQWVEKQANDLKDGAGTMNQTSNATRNIEANGSWRTEKPVRRRLRRLTLVAAAAAAAVILIATPLGDRALGAMQQTFRIQNIVGVGITADDMATISGLLERGSPEGARSFDLAQYGSMTLSSGGEDRTVTWEEADSRMGASLIRLENPSDPSFQPASSLTFRLNAKAINRLLTRLGGSTTLPDEADGKAISLAIPDGVSTEGELAGKPARLLQFGKPELTVEGGIDASTVREAILGLPVLPDNLRTKLAAIGDWQNTLPIPARDGVTSSFQLNGHDAVMTVNGDNRYLLWLDGNRLSLLSAAAKDFPAESAFLQAAEELVQP